MFEEVFTTELASSDYCHASSVAEHYPADEKLESQLGVKLRHSSAQVSCFDVLCGVFPRDQVHRHRSGNQIVDQPIELIPFYIRRRHASRARLLCY